MTRREKCREYQRRYEQTAKGKAAHKRYWRTEAGRAVSQRTRAKQLRLGSRYFGAVTTAEQATAINAVIKERVSAFKRQQARKEAQSVP